MIESYHYDKLNKNNTLGGMETEQLKYHMKLRVYRHSQNFGPGVSTLMKLVRETESLSAACQMMKMSYSKAWKLIKLAEEDLGIALFEGRRGGKRGGRTVLTPAGEALLEQYLKFQEEAGQAVTEIFEKYFKE